MMFIRNQLAEVTMVTPTGTLDKARSVGRGSSDCFHGSRLFDLGR